MSGASNVAFLVFSLFLRKTFGHVTPAAKGANGLVWPLQA